MREIKNKISFLLKSTPATKRKNSTIRNLKIKIIANTDSINV